jgi:origin recognition complex subunit 1
MDLPEKLLPRISSRMGIHRLCFGPYTYQQLQEIILSRLKGIDAFDNQAVEFAARKVIINLLNISELLPNIFS